MRRLLPLVVALPLVLTGCSDPCADLPAPTEQEVDIADSGADIEREVDDTECEINDERDGWVRDD